MEVQTLIRKENNMSTITIIISSKLGTNAWKISEAEDVQIRDWCRTRGQSLPDIIQVVNSLVLNTSDTSKKEDVPEKDEIPEPPKVLPTTEDSRDISEKPKETSDSGDPFHINGEEKKSKKKGGE